MAILLGLSAFELAVLATAAVTALVAASPAGQQAARQTARAIADGIDAVGEKIKTIDLAPPVADTDCPPKKKCPPCPAPPPPRIDRVPPSRPHWPCPGDHVHIFEMNQNPETCQCFPREKEVICLPQGGTLP